MILLIIRLKWCEIARKGKQYSWVKVHGLRSLQFNLYFLFLLCRHFLNLFNRLNYYYSTDWIIFKAHLDCTIIWDRNRLSHYIYWKIIVSLHLAIWKCLPLCWKINSFVMLSMWIQNIARTESQVSMCCICWHSNEDCSNACFIRYGQ